MLDATTIAFEIYFQTIDSKTRSSQVSHTGKSGNPSSISFSEVSNLLVCGHGPVLHSAEAAFQANALSGP